LLEPGLTYARYTSQGHVGINYLLPEVQGQVQIPERVLQPFLGGGLGLAFAWSGGASGARLTRSMGPSPSGPSVLHAASNSKIVTGVESMSRNKDTVRKYIAGFNKSDHAQILSCLTDDIEWLLPGTFHLTGKDAFDKEIENAAFTGSPTVTITRMTEENDVVIAEGTVRVAWKHGGFLNAVFCDVFEMENARIKRLVTYQVNLPEQESNEDSLAQYRGASADRLSA
jgi:uncharacterized protein